MRPTGRQRLVGLGALLIYLASLPALGLLWVSVAYGRFPELGFRDQLYRVGSLSTTILGLLLVASEGLTWRDNELPESGQQRQSLRKTTTSLCAPS